MRPVLFSVPHTGTRFTHNLLMHLGMDPLRQIHTGNPEIERYLDHPCVIPMRDPRLVWLSHCRRLGQVCRWREAVEVTARDFVALSVVLPHLRSYVFLRVDDPDTGQQVADFVGAIRPLDGFVWEAIGDHGDFATDESLFHHYAPKMPVEQILAALKPYRDRYGY